MLRNTLLAILTFALCLSSQPQAHAKLKLGKKFKKLGKKFKKAGKTIKRKAKNTGRKISDTAKKLVGKKIDIKRWNRGPSLKWIRTIKSKKYFDYVVKAEVYPEDPKTLFLTMRKGGISLFDISRPSHPKAVFKWDPRRKIAGKKGRMDVEGQDRRGNLLVVIDRRGALHTFQIKGRRLKELAVVRIPKVGYKRVLPMIIPALHARLYRGKDKKLYAFVSCTASKRFVAFDVTNPRKPRYVSTLKTSIGGLEGIQIYKHHAFIGGFMSKKYQVVDISNPRKMRIVKSLKRKYYNEMVPAMTPKHPGIIFTALFGMPGGLAAFDARNPRKLRELSHVLDMKLSKSNRVKIQGNYAYIPLEQVPFGGVGIIDISNPRRLKKVLAFRKIPKIIRPYTLFVNKNYLYIWGSYSKNMAILQIRK